jgi:branched-chain amino acid transport system permease protein
MSGWLDSILQGLLLGALYALFAAGLSLVFGVMRLVNVAHGDFIVLSAFLALALQRLLGFSSPFLTLILLVPLMFIFGYLLQRTVLNPALGEDILRPVLITFGLSVIIQNGLLQAFSADSQKLHGGRLEVASIALPAGLAVGTLPLLTLVVSAALIGLLQWMLYNTRLGRALRATSDDLSTAGLMGVNTPHLFAVAAGTAMVTVAVAGVFTGVRASFDAVSGPDWLIFAFEAVIIGGLGSLWGTLAGGMILGMAQTTGARFSPSWQLLSGHLVFLAILIFWPRGLFPRRME